jgi:hypothetical protein
MQRKRELRMQAEQVALAAERLMFCQHVEA